MKVQFIRWPAETDRRAQLAESSTPRMLLVEANERAPMTSDPLEDWIRLPADEGDLRARVASLMAATESTARPILDPDGLLHVGKRWIALPPIEASLIGELVKQFGRVVSRDQLTRAGWPTAAPGRNALDVHMLRLRRRIEGLGLSIQTVRSRGYLLEVAGSGAITSAFIKQTDRLA